MRIRSHPRHGAAPLNLRVVLGLVAMAVLASGCGARWTDEQRAEVAARGRGPVAAASEATPGSADPEVAADDSVAGPTVSGATGPSTGTGSQGSTSGVQPAASSLPCAAPSKEIGVTDGEIVIGEISSLSGPVPGLSSSSAAAVRAYVAQRNATGGVCGRRLVLLEADDGTDSGRYRSMLSDLAPKVLGIAGGFAVGDIGSADLINRFQIPIVNSPTGRTGELRWVFDINPDFPEPDMLIGKYKYLYAQGARKVSMSYIAVEQSRIESRIQRGLMEAAGLEVVHVNELPLSTLSYDAAARAAANSGANYMWFTADTNGQASMARSVRESGHRWLFKEFTYTTYGTNFIERAGVAAEGATSWIRSLPTEEAASNPVMRSYVEWMDRVGRGLPKDLFSIDSYVSAKVFIESLEALPGPISREALVRQLESIRSYTAGGMFAPIDLGQDLSQGCFMAMIVRNGKWQRLTPARGYLC